MIDIPNCDACPSINLHASGRRREYEIILDPGKASAAAYLVMRSPGVSDSVGPVLMKTAASTDGNVMVESYMVRDQKPGHDSLKEYRAAIELMDSNDQRRPTSIVTQKLLSVIRQCEASGLRPSRVNISVEGGAVVQFVNGKAYGDIELLNTGEVLASLSSPGARTVVWDLGDSAKDGVLQALQRISAQIYEGR